MTADKTELVFIIDKSGSMYGLEKDTIGGFNSVISKQKDSNGEAFVTTVLFSTERRILHDRTPLRDIRPMTGKDYTADGCTALLDAVGITVSQIRRVHSAMREEDVPGKTMVVITTDGLENSSREYTYDSLKRLIDQCREEGWEFIFMGANIDAPEEASRFGISEEFAVNYRCDSEGLKACYDSVSDAVECCLHNIPLDNNWRRKADRDFEDRV